jgi:hypothetical protein
MLPDARRGTLVLFLAIAIFVIVALVFNHQAELVGVIARPQVSAGGEHQPGPLAPRNAFVGPPEFAPAADREISQLHEGITLAKWTELQGKENVGKEKHVKDSDCVNLEKTQTLPAGGQITRTVYFIAPRAPSPAVLPTLTGQELINATCTLAMIRVATKAATPEAGHALAVAGHQQFELKYGANARTSNINTGLRGSLTPLDIVRGPAGLEVSFGYNPDFAPVTPEHAVLVGSAAVMGMLPRVHDTTIGFRYRAIEYTQFHRALSMAGVDGAISARMEMVYEEAYKMNVFPQLARQPSGNTWRESLLPVLRDWLGALKALAPAERAAGLLAADRLLAAAGDIDENSPVGAKKPELVSGLQDLAPGFNNYDPGSTYHYTANWLTQARALDPEGAVGQMATRVTLARGDCYQEGWGTEPFRKVILEGEQLLAKTGDATTSAQVHFMVGDAYSDIVASAESAYASKVDPSKIRQEADAARAKALEHYRAGLAVGGISENAKDAWEQGWHLSAGIAPHTRYVCYDGD